MPCWSIILKRGVSGNGTIVGLRLDTSSAQSPRRAEGGTKGTLIKQDVPEDVVWYDAAPPAAEPEPEEEKA